MKYSAMRELTDREIAERDLRREEFERFIAERMPVLADFADALGLKQPTMIVAQPEHYLPSIDLFMEKQVIRPDDRNWILTRIGYFIGELLVDRLGGCWFLNEIADSRYFLRYVVGQFARVQNPNAMVDPFYVAVVFVDQPPGRRLAALVQEVEAELRAA